MRSVHSSTMMLVLSAAAVLGAAGCDSPSDKPGHTTTTSAELAPADESVSLAADEARKREQERIAGGEAENQAIMEQQAAEAEARARAKAKANGTTGNAPPPPLVAPWPAPPPSPSVSIAPPPNTTQSTTQSTTRSERQ